MSVNKKTMNRLQLMMLEYNITIKSKPEKENLVSDFLSRNPISAVDVQPREMQTMQWEDPGIAKLRKDMREKSTDATFLHLSRNLEIHDDILCKRQSNGELAIFAPAAI